MDAQGQSWDAEAADRAVAVLKAVADPSRYRLLWALSRQELPVSALAELLGAHVAATSQHLAKLRAAGLVVSRREGTRIYYRAADVRGLLDEAALVARPADGAVTAVPDASPDPTTAAQEQTAPARRRPVRAGRRRPATEH
ncbi:ArsR/SmtB family transcription factor [Streptomyces aureoverticillatus]|uniref:ArsR/SmtB family transcription factor n=1 Tax=Streptomyces aureoverticillatus TaxID=66871 RepID=UPI0013DB0392|nr:metalloregulator ArsR/SmtB family transcription factor [Streptomyces aureoverticillatus]QIB47229.1 winged helix-turn-helix transcriptional regulator [Streptomyces aureoverticillatus]